MNKFIRGACVALGLALFGASYYLYNNFTNMPKTTFVADNNYHVEHNDNSSSSADLVMVKGKLNVTVPAEDSLTGVKAKYPLVQRRVEMYQYFLKDGKAMVGWKEGRINDFTHNGNKYSNPSLPSGLKSKLFYGRSVIGDGNLEIDPAFLTKDLDWNKHEKAFGYLSNLPSDNIPNGFVYKKNHYLKQTQHKQKVGSIRIAYRVLNHRELPELTIIGQQKNRRLTRSNSDCRFYDVPIELTAIEKTYRQDTPHAAAGAALFGAFFILLGVFKSRA